MEEPIMEFPIDKIVLNEFTFLMGLSFGFSSMIFSLFENVGSLNKTSSRIDSRVSHNSEFLFFSSIINLKIVIFF
jgi:hypothetical protein